MQKNKEDGRHERRRKVTRLPACPCITVSTLECLSLFLRVLQLLLLLVLVVLPLEDPFEEPDDSVSLTTCSLRALRTASLVRFVFFVLRTILAVAQHSCQLVRFIFDRRVVVVMHKSACVRDELATASITVIGLVLH